MNPALLQLLSVQGEIKIRLMGALPQEAAHEIAADLLDYIARSPIVTPEHRAAYKALEQSA
jgi:hypothetical protein